MSGQKGLLLVSVFLLSILSAPLSRAQDEQDFTQDQISEVVSHARIVRLSHIEGTAQLDSDRGFENATVNTPIAEGDRLLARSDAWAEIQFEDGSTVRLSPDTQITFAQLGLNADGGTVTAIDLDQGEAEFTIQKHDDSDFAVTARNKTIFLKHSGRFRVTSTNSTPLQVVVWKGEVNVGDSATGSHVTVKKNEDFTLDPFDFDKYDLEKGALADDLDNWSQQRDEDLSTYAKAGTGNYTQSPYAYGLSDLNYYGTYYNVPGYGYLWQPAGTNLGWDPYMNGYWTWSPVYGYCWVSAYPWGWMPYRYGRWMWVGGYGWMWQPGNWHGWRPTPRLWNTPPGFHPPAPPTRMVLGRPGTPPVGVKPGTVQPGGVRPGTVQPRPGTAGTPPGRVGPQPGSQSAPSGGGLQVPRVDAQRGHRVFTNEEIQDRVPRKDTAAAPAGVVRMDRRDETAQPTQPPVRTVETPARSSGPTVQPAQPSGSQPKEARPADAGRVRPSEVPRRPVESPREPAAQERPAPAAVPRQQPATTPRTEAPPPPVMHERPAPATVPRQQSAPQQPAPRSVSPPPAPRAEPAPVPRTSSPPPAPASHASSPPPAPAPRAGVEHGSRPSESRSPERPK